MTDIYALAVPVARALSAQNEDYAPLQILDEKGARVGARLNLRRGAGESLSMQPGQTQRGKETVLIAGLHPARHFSVPHPSNVGQAQITVPVDTKPEKIAQQIMSDLLPKYYENFSAAEAAWADDQKRHEQRRDWAALASGFLPHAVTDKRMGSEQRVRVYFGDDSESELVINDGDGPVHDMVLRGITLGQAIAIAKILSSADVPETGE